MALDHECILCSLSDPESLKQKGLLQGGFSGQVTLASSSGMWTHAFILMTEADDKVAINLQFFSNNFLKLLT